MKIKRQKMNQSSIDIIDIISIGVIIICLIAFVGGCLIWKITNHYKYNKFDDEHNNF